MRFLRPLAVLPRSILVATMLCWVAARYATGA